MDTSFPELATSISQTLPEIISEKNQGPLILMDQSFFILRTLLVNRVKTWTTWELIYADIWF